MLEHVTRAAVVSLKKARFIGTLVGAASLISAAPVRAQSILDESGRIPGVPEPSIASSLPKELADPGGMRSRLARTGIMFGLNYIGETLANPTGGFKQGGYYDGRLELVLAADLEKLIGWKGLSFFTNGYQIHGESITEQNLGALMPVSFIEAISSTRLFEIWLEQKLWDDKLSIRFGELAADSEFMVSEGSGAFMNGTWGWPLIAAANMPQGGPAYPLPTPGMRIAYAPSDQLRFMTGVYDGRSAGDCADDENPQVCNLYGPDFAIDDPALWLFESAFSYNQRENELAGTIKIGGWRNHGNFPHERFDEFGGETAITHNHPVALNGDYGFYGIIDQMIYRIPGKGNPKGVSLLGRVITAPEDRNPVSLYWEAGLILNGLAKSRPDDILGIGYARTIISNDLVAARAAMGESIIPSYEAVFEASYTAQVVPGFILQPDFQYFWNPGAHAPDPNDPAKAIPNAAVLGLRAMVNY